MNEFDILKYLSQAIQVPLFTVNRTPVTISSVIIFIGILGGILLVSRALRRLMASRVLPRFQLPSSTQYTAIRIMQYATWFIGVFLAFQFIGIDLSGLAIIFGFLSVGIGFGLQNLTSNFISGIILLFEQHIRVGDRVTVAGTEGDVVEINIRSTTIRTLNNIAIVVPNSEFISSPVINWLHGDPKTRVEIDVGVSYSSRLDTVISCLLEAAKDEPEVLTDPKPEVLLLGFGDSAWNMRLWAWVASPKGRLRVQSRINCAIVKNFREHGVEIPFPQRDLHIRSPLPVPLASQVT